MPRKSAAALTVVPVNVTGRARLRAPAGLSEAVREIFVELVTANDVGHFSRSDVPLLVEYATAIAQARRAAEGMEKEGPVVRGRSSPWLVVQEKATRAMVALSMRLRLSPQSRFDARAASRSAARPGSAYDVMGESE